MQIRPEFVPETEEQLRNVETNVRVAMRLLKKKKQRCRHQRDKTWVVCYNAGIRGGSRIRKPQQFSYYKKFLTQLKLL